RRIAKATVMARGLLAMARRAQGLPTAAIPEHRLITAMRIDVVDDARWADHAMLVTLHAQRMIVQEGCTFRLPSLRAIERAGDRIALALVVTVAFTLFAPTNCAMDRWTDGQGNDLDNDEGIGNDNARAG